MGLHLSAPQPSGRSGSSYRQKPGSKTQHEHLVAHTAHHVQADLGYGLHPNSSGHGYATEAVTEVLRICFDVLGLRRVTADCFADNTPSWRLMERVGMRRESHTVRDSLHRSGAWLDGLAYALLAEEWTARHGAASGG